MQDLLKTVGLTQTCKKKVVRFSLGMRHHLSIAIALFGNPNHLIIDELINCLDLPVSKIT
ncbi:ATP-binding cassette domain-containing protein [bacterium c-19]|nr:ATP-binding cassette domain-containing protein [bacterium c-19]